MTGSGTDDAESEGREPHPSERVPADFEVSDPDNLSDREVRLLLRDHESVGDDARYRDRLILTGFYLSLIFTGFLLDIGVRLLDQERFLLLSAIAGFGALSYYILWVWTRSFTSARNAAWNRRRQIEHELNRHYPGYLKGHVDLFDRLTFHDEERTFEHLGRSGKGSQSGGDLTQFLIKLEFSGALFVSGVAFWYGTSLRFGPVVGTLLVVPVFVVLPLVVMKIGRREG